MSPFFSNRAESASSPLLRSQLTTRQNTLYNSVDVYTFTHKSLFPIPQAAQPNSLFSSRLVPCPLLPTPSQRPCQSDSTTISTKQTQLTQDTRQPKTQSTIASAYEQSTASVHRSPSPRHSCLGTNYTHVSRESCRPTKCTSAPSEALPHSLSRQIHRVRSVASRLGLSCPCRHSPKSPPQNPFSAAFGIMWRERTRGKATEFFFLFLFEV
jgi:hypothetical protein